jgi:hypothetical protein
MGVAIPLDTTLALEMRGRLGFGRGYGFNAFGYSRYGSFNNVSGIYSRKLIASGDDWQNAKKAGRWAISAMRFYRPTNPQTEKQQTWRGFFTEGKVQYDLLTTGQRALLSKEARKRRMTGYNLFQSRWLASHRGLL